MNQLKLTELLEVKSGNVITVQQDGSRNYIKKQFSILKEVEFVDRFSRLLQIIIDFSLLNLIYYCSIKTNIINFTFFNWLIIFESYYLFSELIFNTTIGKKIFGHVIIDIYGIPLNKKRIVLRNFSRLIPIDPFSLIGLRPLHDFIAQSYLIHHAELNQLLELKRLNIEELKIGNILYSVDRYYEKLALKRKKDLIDELNKNAKNHSFPSFLVNNYQKTILNKPINSFYIKKNLPAEDLILGPPSIGIIISIIIFSIIKPYNVFPQYETILALSCLSVFITMLFIKPSIEINNKRIKIHNGFKEVIHIKNEDCLYIYFTLTKSARDRREAIGILLADNTEKIIKFNIARDKKKIGEALYSWMKHIK